MIIHKILTIIAKIGFCDPLSEYCIFMKILIKCNFIPDDLVVGVHY